MNDIAIRVQNLSKCYHIYDNPRDRLKQFVIPKLCRAIPALNKFFSAPNSLLPTSQGVSIPHSQLPTSQAVPVFHKEFWALKDVSFEIKKGETVGIIGRNGSGKSTLLQLICGTLNPTGGSIQTNGRIAALLELGSGFNPEFTGRENVYLNGAVLGLSKDEVDAKFDAIAAFADIGDFIEQPVKTYSSGMVVRLAFAVAINVDPQILIVDEALSVGDELFQRKCFSRIEAIRSSGATILFVSHSGASIVELCDRAVLMDAGEKLAVGVPKKIVGYYQKLLYASADKHVLIRETIRRLTKKLVGSDNAEENIFHINNADELAERSVGLQESFDPNLNPSSTIQYESIGAHIESASIFTLTGKQVNNLIRGEFYHYTYIVAFTQSATNVHFAMLVKTTSGLELGGGVSAASPRESIPYVEPGTIYRIKFHFQCILNPGIYFLNCGVVGDVNGTQTYLHRLIDAAMFRVLPISENKATAIIDFGCQSVIERQYIQN